MDNNSTSHTVERAYPKSAQEVSFDERDIERLVRTFYAKVKDDSVIGPVFARRVEEWEPHLQQMMSFWTAVLTGVGGYSPGGKGSPLVMHRAIEELEHRHFERWVSLFEPVVHDVFSDEQAELVLERMRRIRGSLSKHLRDLPNVDAAEKPYKSLRFAPGEIPLGLQKDHQLKAGVRGELWVTEGSLVFVDSAGVRHAVSAGEKIAIPPEDLHYLDDIAGAAIVINFFRVV